MWSWRRTSEARHLGSLNLITSASSDTYLTNSLSRAVTLFEGRSIVNFEDQLADMRLAPQIPCLSCGEVEPEVSLSVWDDPIGPETSKLVQNAIEMSAHIVEVDSGRRSISWL